MILILMDRGPDLDVQCPAVSMEMTGQVGPLIRRPGPEEHPGFPPVSLTAASLLSGTY